MTVPSTEFKQRLSSISWFSNCGTHVSNSNPSLVVASSWADAITAYHDPLWDYVIVEAHNAITTYLSTKYARRFEEWNKIIREAKAFLKEDIEPKIQAYQQANGLDQTLIDHTNWNILHAIMEDAYRDCKIPTNFFSELLAIYEAGKLPCGWIDGEWPQGKLVVY